MSEQRLIQKFQHRPLLQTQCLYHSQYALDETAARLTMTTKRILTPQHSRAQQAFNVIVRRLDAVFARKSPQSRFNGQHVGAKGRRLAICAGAPSLQPLTQRLPHQGDFTLKGAPAHASAAEGVPQREYHLHRAQPHLTGVFGVAAAVYQFLEIPLQMGPAQLPQPKLQLTIHRPAVAGNDALDLLAQQRGQTRGTARGSDDKASYPGRGSAPQPTLLAGLLPPGFIDILGFSFLDRDLGLAMGVRQRSTHFLFEVADRAQRDRHFADGLNKLLDTTFAGVQNTAQKTHGRCESGTTNVGANVLRDFRPSDLAAIGTGAAMGLKLRHLHGNLWQFDDLVPVRLGIVRARCHRQVVLTGFTNLGPIMLDWFSETLPRQAHAQISNVSRLAPGLAPRRLLANGRRCIGRVGRWWHRRVRRIPTESGFQLAEPSFEFGNPFQKLTATWTRRLIHADIL